MTKKFLLFLILTLGISAFAQTTTNYAIPSGQQACSTNGPQTCTFYPDGIVRNGYGRFQTGTYWTQLVFDSYNAENCWDPFTYAPSQVWQVADTDITPGPLPTVVSPTISYSSQSGVKLYTMDCASSTLVGGHTLQEGHTVHAEILAYSYTRNYVCGSRVRTVCHQTQWATVEGSFVEVIQP
jgi:hypothetical protein